MKKIFKIIAIVFTIGLLFLLGSNNITKADDIALTISNGARIRTDEKMGLQFEGTINNKEAVTSVGFIVYKGITDKATIVDLKDATFEEAAFITDTTFAYAISCDDYNQKYTCLACAIMGEEKIYSEDVIVRSMVDVAQNLGEGYATYVDNVLSHQEGYFETTVNLYPAGGVFSDSTKDNKTIVLKDPCALPTITKDGYKFMGWKKVGENNIYQSYEGITMKGQTITYIAQWSLLPNATTLINELLPNELESEYDLSLSYDEKECKWSVEENDFISIKKGKLIYSDLYKDHYTHNVKVTLEYDGTTATKIYRIKPQEFKDLSKTNPFAVYFAISSLSNYTNYIDDTLGQHSIDDLFPDKVEEELDILYYAFAGIDQAGNVTLSKYSSHTKVMNQLYALRQKGTRIVLSIAGTSDTACGYFNTICASDELRATFVKNLIDTIEYYHFDGIDIDWESASSQNVVDATRMNALMKDLRTEMDKRTGSGPKYLLTAAIPSTSWGAAQNRFDLKTLNDYLDYVNMMSYDLNHEEKATHVSALYSSSYDNGYKFSAVYGVELFTQMGLSKNKILLGSAGYGKAYKVTGTSSNSNYPGLGAAATLTKINNVLGSYNSGTIYYNGVLDLIKNSDYKQYTEYNSKGQYVGNYLYNEKDKIFVAYEGEEMIGLKAEYAKENGMGIMMWSYGEDGSGKLCLAIANKIHS